MSGTAPDMCWETSAFAHGPAVVKWLVDQGYYRPEGPFGVEMGTVRRRDYALSESDVRRIRDWAQGGAVTFWKLDRMLTLVGRHVSELPDDCWLPSEVDTVWKLGAA